MADVTYIEVRLPRSASPHRVKFVGGKVVEVRCLIDRGGSLRTTQAARGRQQGRLTWSADSGKPMPITAACAARAAIAKAAQKEAGR